MEDETGGRQGMCIACGAGQEPPGHTAALKQKYCVQNNKRARGAGREGAVLRMDSWRVQRVAGKKPNTETKEPGVEGSAPGLQARPSGNV